MAVSKKLLVVGGTGFLGSHLVRYLSKNYKVTSLSKGNTINFNKELNVEYAKCDLENTLEAKKFFFQNKFNYIINSGGYVNHNNFLIGGDKVFENHLKIILNILKNTIDNKPDKLIQIGSSDEYGYDSSNPKEDTRENPLSPYSMGKLAATQVCMMFAKEYNYPLNVIRPFLIYGPGQNKNRIIPFIINSCLKNKEFNLGNKDTTRDFLYITDFIEFVVEIMDKDTVNGEIFNIGSGSGIRLEFLVQKIIEIIKKGKPLFGNYKSEKYEIPKLVANLEKVNKHLNWKQKTSLDQGLKETIKSHIA